LLPDFFNTIGPKRTRAPGAAAVTPLTRPLASRAAAALIEERGIPKEPSEIKALISKPFFRPYSLT
jgi:hypothetical protein